MVATKRFHACASHIDERLDDGRGDGVAEERGVEGRVEAARPTDEPVAMQHAVVQCRVGVLMCRERPVNGFEGGAAIGLHPAGRENGAILAVGDDDLLSGRQRDRRPLDVGRRQRLVRFVRRRLETAGQRDQSFARLVEHVLLLPVEVLDRESIDSERGIGEHPFLDGRQRRLQQLWIEPGCRLRPSRQQRLDLLTPGVDGVVALVLVVAERGVVVDLVGELPEVVAGLHRRDQLGRSLCQRPAQ